MACSTEVARCVVMVRASFVASAVHRGGARGAAVAASAGRALPPRAHDASARRPRAVETSACSAVAACA
eukprot:4947011-Pleurochrysis_carterae.AAC.1